MLKKIMMMSFLLISSIAVADCDPAMVVDNYELDITAELQEESSNRVLQRATRAQYVTSTRSVGDVSGYLNLGDLIVHFKTRQNIIRDGSGRAPGVAMKVKCLRCKDDRDLTPTRIYPVVYKSGIEFVSWNKSKTLNFRIDDKKRVTFVVTPRPKATTPVVPANK